MPADVVILHLDEDDDAKETADAVAREGRRCLVLKGDVKDAKFCAKAVEKAVSDAWRRTSPARVAF